MGNSTWVRPAIAIIAALGITAGFFLKMISADAYIGIMAVAITWFFKSRDEKRATTPPQ